MACFIGFSTLNAIVGGQTLAAASSPSPSQSSLSASAGIVIIGVVSLGIGFCGYRVVHAFERWCWIPVCLAFVILAGIGGKNLKFHPDPAPSSAANILSFIAIIGGFTISYSGCAADFNAYMRADASSWAVFSYTFAGLYLGIVPLQMLGAAFMLSALSPELPNWGEAFDQGGVGSLVGEVLTGPGGCGGFGKFLLVIIGCGMISNNAPTIYAFSNNLQLLIPMLLQVPRFVFAVLATAIYIPLAIVGADSFATELQDFLGLLGYWYSIFAAIVIVEHLVYRSGKFSSYEISFWNSPSKLPPGIAATVATLSGIAIVLCTMDAIWFRGPVAKAISGKGVDFGGDLAFETGFVVSGLVYFIARGLEKRIFKR